MTLSSSTPRSSNADDSNGNTRGRVTTSALLVALSLSLLSLIIDTQNMRRTFSSQGFAVPQLDLVTPNKSSSNALPPQEDEFFSACLLTKDDSHFLIEWLAYHYHTLPLRHLIVSVDPTSKTSPSFIFDKWRNRGMMTIEEWTDEQFLKGRRPEGNKHASTNMHRFRQGRFYEECSKKLKKDNSTWTLFIDVDEYLSYNTYTRESTPDIQKPGTFMSFLKEEMPKSKNETELQSQLPCITMPRLRYGSVESKPSKVAKAVPRGLNGTAFQTLRYRRHGDPEAVHGAGKSIVDVSRIKKKKIRDANAHRPVPVCLREHVWISVLNSALVVRHYLGSWEQFHFRQDRRWENGGGETGMKSRETYDKDKDINHAAEDAIRPWLQGFVDDVGEATALELLDGVGDTSIAPPMTNTTGSLSSFTTTNLKQRASLLVETNSNVSLPTVPVWSPSRLKQTGTGLARTFPKHEHWRTHDGYHKNNLSEAVYKWDSPTGLLYVKVPKSASSTTAAVVKRISHNHDDCDYQYDHVQGAGQYFGNRDREKSFLLGSVRDPASRAISRVFFQQVSRGHQKPTDSNVLKWLNDGNIQFGTVSPGQGGFQLRYMALNKIPSWSAWNRNAPTQVNNATKIHENVRKVIDDYDFVVVVERMDESLVVLQMLLGVEIGDMLTLDSKTQGMYTYGPAQGCFEITKANVSSRVKDHLSSDTWFAQNYGDYLLHATANASLDKTIEFLGRKRVGEALTEYRRLKSMAHEKCTSSAIFPCSSEGVKQLKQSRKSCYSGDMGCGYRCIDEMIQSLRVASS